MKIVLKIQNLEAYQDALKRVTLGTVELNEAVEEFNKAVENLEFETVIEATTEAEEGDDKSIHQDSHPTSEK